MDSYEHSTGIDKLIERLRNKESKAREELIAYTLERLQKLTRRMFRKYPGLKTLEETDDIVQKLVIRLHRMLNELVPENTAAFFRLASQNIRWVLYDLAKSSASKYRPLNSSDLASNDPKNDHRQAVAPEGEPSSLIEWADFYGKINQLPEENRQIFDLLWFQGLSQIEAAKALNMPTRTFTRKWTETKLLIRVLMHNQGPPGEDSSK
jgi:RNA polymerase sigma factor (sigma-70 family)